MWRTYLVARLVPSIKTWWFISEKRDLTFTGFTVILSAGYSKFVTELALQIYVYWFGLQQTFFFLSVKKDLLNEEQAWEVQAPQRRLSKNMSIVEKMPKIFMNFLILLTLPCILRHQTRKVSPYALKYLAKIPSPELAMHTEGVRLFIPYIIRVSSAIRRNVEVNVFR